MALSTNPTKTRGDEKRWRREINKRWREFTAEITTELKRIDTLGRNDPASLAFNAADPFTASPAQLRAYMVFMQTRIDRILLGTTAPPNWQAQHQLDSYRRGVERATAALIAQGASPELTAVDQAVAAQITGEFTARPTLGTFSTGALGAPIHQDTLEFLFTRSYESLNKWTAAMASEVRQILFEGVRDGKGIRELTRQIVERVGVSKSSAERIARTETIQAFQRGSNNASARASEVAGIEIKQRWITARDGRVRHQHAIWHGTVTSVQEANRRIGVSPWNCRCAVIPVIPEADTERKRGKFSAERKELLELEG